MEKLVSVIMAEYNTNEKLLKESIKSILNQTYKNLELIIIDDCGKNNLSKIVDEFHDDRIKVYKNNQNMGLVYSLNKALNKSQGEYIARLDTDDYAYENRLEIQVNFLNNHPDIALVGSNVDYVDDKEIWGRTKGSYEVTRERLLKSFSIIHSSMMFRKEAFVKIGGYVDYKRCEDYATFIELYLNGYKMYQIDDVLMKVHLSVDDYKKRSLKTRKGFFKFLKYQYKKLNPSRLQLVKMYTKNFIAGIVPHKIMFLYHKKKFKRSNV